MVQPTSRTPPACADAMRSGSDGTLFFFMTLLMSAGPPRAAGRPQRALPSG